MSRRLHPQEYHRRGKAAATKPPAPRRWRSGVRKEGCALKQQPGEKAAPVKKAAPAKKSHRCKKPLGGKEDCRAGKPAHRRKRACTRQDLPAAKQSAAPAKKAAPYRKKAAPPRSRPLALGDRFRREGGHQGRHRLHQGLDVKFSEHARFVGRKGSCSARRCGRDAATR